MLLPFSLCINFIRYFFSICQKTKGTQKPILTFICDHIILIYIRLTHSLFCSISYLLQHIKPLHDVLWNMCSIKSSIPVSPASFLKMVFMILLQQKPPFKIDVGVVAIPLWNEISWKDFLLTMSNSTSLIFSWVYFSHVFTTWFHWSCFCHNQQWLKITKYDVRLSVHILFDH